MKITEGPHLYKKDGWYYLFAAEGGTVYEHQESVARSHTLDEYSFEVMPNGPFIGNFDTPDTYLQKQGHGALVDTPSGEWYYAPYAVVRGVMIPNRLMHPRMVHTRTRDLHPESRMG